MITLEVALGARSYPILIGTGLLADVGCFDPFVRGRQVLLVSNETVAPLYAATLRRGLVSAREIAVVLLPDGEAYKNLSGFERILSALLEARFERGCVLVALGGGVIGDIAGFAAACYQRGVDYLQVPTTLLAQVDSSVGGKTAVNHPAGKNMIGAFHQPRAVVADLATLETLPAREFAAGVAEIIKYGLIDDPAFLGWLEASMPALLAQDAATVAHAVECACRAKARIVGLDERESGLRALLNLGHTFGHGIEHALGYGEWLHGEAVAAGMCMAARMSVRCGLLEARDAARAIALIRAAGLPIFPPRELDAADILAAMQVDKKNQDGRIRLVLLKGLGGATLVDTYSVPALQETLRERDIAAP